MRKRGRRSTSLYPRKSDHVEKRHRSYCDLSCHLLPGVAWSQPASQPDKMAPEVVEFFEKSVRPVLAERCVRCHGPEKAKGRPAPRQPRGDAQGQRDRPRHRAGPAREEPAHRGRPPKGRLENAARRKAARGSHRQPRPSGSRPAHLARQRRGDKAPAVEAWKSHWAFQPVKKAAPPAVQHQDRVQTPIDAFILAELEKPWADACRPADKRTLLRRATFDLIGLPPTPEEVDAFEADTSPGRLRQGGRPPAGLAALRRALGPPLARRRPLRRHQGLRLPGRAPLRLLPTPTAITSSRPSTTICPTTSSSSSNSPPTGLPRPRPATTTRSRWRRWAS